MSDEQIAQFLDAHPDWTVALTSVGAPYGLIGPEHTFCTFEEILQVLVAK